MAKKSRTLGLQCFRLLNKASERCGLVAMVVNNGDCVIINFDLENFKVLRRVTKTAYRAFYHETLSKIMVPVPSTGLFLLQNFKDLKILFYNEKKSNSDILAEVELPSQHYYNEIEYLGMLEPSEKPDSDSDRKSGRIEKRQFFYFLAMKLNVASIHESFMLDKQTFIDVYCFDSLTHEFSKVGKREVLDSNSIYKLQRANLSTLNGSLKGPNEQDYISEFGSLVVCGIDGSYSKIEVESLNQTP